MGVYGRDELGRKREETEAGREGKKGEKTEGIYARSNTKKKSQSS